MRILLADDDPDILEPLEIALRREGFTVLAARDGARAWDLYVIEQPDFVVLDIAMPGLDGLELMRRINQQGGRRVPIIMLTGKDQERDKVAALDIGADDYVIKPCSYRELIARIRAIARRSTTTTPILTVGDLRIDTDTYRFYVRGQQIGVTTTEFAILRTLIENAGRVVQQRVLMQRVWGYDVSEDLLRVTIHRLRRKIEPGKTPHYIHTVRDVGFIIPNGALTDAVRGGAVGTIDEVTAPLAESSGPRS